MGRHRKAATDEGKIVKQDHVANPPQAVEDRLGLTGQVCSSCDARNPADADTCRKCGSSDLRPKADQFRDA